VLFKLFFRFHSRRKNITALWNDWRANVFAIFKWKCARTSSITPEKSFDETVTTPLLPMIRYFVTRFVCQNIFHDILMFLNFFLLAYSNCDHWSDHISTIKLIFETSVTANVLLYFHSSVCDVCVSLKSDHLRTELFLLFFFYFASNNACKIANSGTV